MSTLTSRRRILDAINHRESDRVPIDLGATPSSGISAIAYNRLKEHLGVKNGNTRIYDVVQELAQPEDDLIERFGIDVIDIGRTFNVEADDWYEITLSDGSRAEYPVWFRPRENDDGSLDAFSADGTRIATKPVGATFFDTTCFPYLEGYPSSYSGLPEAMSKVHWSALVHSPWDHAGEPDFWDQLRARTLQLRESTDKALMVVCGCNLFEWGTFLRRIDNFLMDLVTEPEEVERLLDALMEQHLGTLEKVCAAVGDVVDIVRFGDDLGCNQGPFMSPDTYRKLFKPRHTILNDYVHENSRMHTFLHSCGSVYRLIPDFIEAGFEILNPVQTNCADMGPQKLKNEFGREITFWGGGCDTSTVLNRGSAREVEDHVAERIEILGPGGGFVFNTVHNILPDVPPENVVAMFRAFDKYSAY